MSTETFTQECEIITETDKAILIDVNGERIWIPLTQVEEIYRAKRGPDSITMTAWIAKMKGLI